LEAWSWFGRRARAELSAVLFANVIFEAPWRELTGGCEYVLWNPAILGKVSRSAEFRENQAYGFCTAGAPKRVEQGFWCTKSAKSAPSLQSLHLTHLMHTF